MNKKLNTFLSLFYIKNRNQTTTTDLANALELKLFYIKNRNQTTTTDP